MAVQAQYPSNVLLLNNNRNGQEMKNNNNDYSLLQTQTNGGLMLDQSQMFFHNNGVMGGNNNSNPRKRGREICFNGGNVGNNSSTTTTSTAAPINLFSVQPQPPTLINLSQLHNQNHHHQQQQQQQPHLGLRLAFNEHQQSSMLSDDLTWQIKQQRDEIDQFLQLQGDQLRRTLAERRQAHYRALLGVAEESASKRLREKETEVQKAIRRNAELEERVAQLRVEAQVWQNKARNQEATAAALQVQLQQAMMMNNNAQDKREEGGGCSGGGGEADDAESAHIDPERVSCSGPGCKTCREGAASVVLLPCRHLALCTSCNATVDTCPVCLSYKTASVEVYLS